MATNTSSAISCRPASEIPDLSNLPIPQNLNVVATPGNDTSFPPMAICCAPNLVQIVDRCYLWCEIPKSYFNGTDKNGAMSGFSACMLLHKPDTDGLRITGYQFNAAPRLGAMGSARRIGVWVLALSGLIYMM